MVASSVTLTTPDPFARAFLIVVVLATAGIQIWIATGVARPKPPAEGKSRGNTGVLLMAVGAIAFLAAVQIAAITSLVAGPIAMWPHVARLCLMWLAYFGIATVVLGIIMNLRRSFR